VKTLHDQFTSTRDTTYTSTLGNIHTLPPDTGKLRLGHMFGNWDEESLQRAGGEQHGDAEANT